MLQITKNEGSRRGYRLTSELRVPALRDQVFALFSDAFELERLTPSWLNFSVTTLPPIKMRTGAIIDYRLRIHGIPLKWQSRIDCWEPPIRFSDIQVIGPYRYWEHLHSFEEDGDGTICRDEVQYDFWGGSVIHNLFVKRDLIQIFTYRSQVLHQIFAPNVISAPTALVSS